MGKIRGKFTPLFSELGDDERFLMKLNNRQKLIYLLVLHTIYQCNNAAPTTSEYYVNRYHLVGDRFKKRLSYALVASDLAHILRLYPKIMDDGKKLSLLKYIGYENRVANNRYIEGEGELEIEGEGEGEGKGTAPNPPPIEQKKDPTHLLQNPLFASLTESEKERIKETYPKEFLIDRLTHYIESAAAREKPIALMLSSTVKRFLAKDFEDFKNAKAHETQTKKESTVDRRKELEENAAPPPEEFKQLKKKLKGEPDEEAEKEKRSAGQVCA